MSAVGVVGMQTHREPDVIVRARDRQSLIRVNLVGTHGNDFGDAGVTGPLYYLVSIFVKVFKVNVRMRVY
jgi:hypothetical protein